MQLRSGNYYGASETSAVFRRLPEISEYERPARPAVITRLQGLYLSNHSTDLHAVIFIG